MNTQIVPTDRDGPVWVRRIWQASKFVSDAYTYIIYTHTHCRNFIFYCRASHTGDGEGAQLWFLLLLLWSSSSSLLLLLFALSLKGQDSSSLARSPLFGWGNYSSSLETANFIVLVLCLVCALGFRSLCSFSNSFELYIVSSQSQPVNLFALPGQKLRPLNRTFHACPYHPEAPWPEGHEIYVHSF